jgi:hypothetical protein
MVDSPGHCATNGAVTAEGSQSAPANPEGSQSAPVQGQASGNQSLRIAILVVVAALVGVGLYLAFGNSSNKKKKHHGQNLTTAILPVALSKSQLLAKPGILDQPMYWIGPKKNFHYEFRRLPNNRIFIRYLPKGVKKGKKPGQLLIVATYPWPNAYASLKKYAKGTQTAGKNGTIIVPSRPRDTKSVLMAFPGGHYEIEVYSPKPGKAATIAASGQVASVG